jgi:hypothetical protein
MENLPIRISAFLIQTFNRRSQITKLGSYPPDSNVNPLTLNDLQRRRAVSHLKIKIPSKNMREKPTNTQINHSVY